MAAQKNKSCDGKKPCVQDRFRNCIKNCIIFALLLMFSVIAVKEIRVGTRAAETYDVVVLGDSIYGLTRDETSIPARLEQYLGKTVYNGALGGTCMGRLNEQPESSNMKDVLSMVSLSRAIVSGDFRLQENLKLEENGTEYFAETLAGLKEIDFSNVEILLIGHCVNDYHAGEMIYPAKILAAEGIAQTEITTSPKTLVGRLNAADDDEHTFTGALRSSVRMLQKAYPDLRIVLLTPPYTWYTLQGLTCEEYLLGGNVLEDYVNAEFAVAEELGIEIIDLYHDVFPHETWDDWQIYSADGLHPNEAGRDLLARIIAERLMQEP